jgi:anti-sigma-K factor RskA
MNTNASDLARDPPDDDLLAAELVLGVLDAGERRAAQARAQAEVAFAGRVAAWERRLGGLVDEVVPVPVPPRTWDAIRVRLGWERVPSGRVGLWDSLAFWRGLGVAGVALAAAMAAYVATRTAPEALPAPVPAPVVVVPDVPTAPVVTLASDAGDALFLVTVDRKGGHVRLVPVPSAPDAEGRVPELWLIPPGQAPVSLGVVDTAWTREIDVPKDLRWALGEDVGSLMAVSLEPKGGAPNGAPTGPIVAKGTIDL